MDIIEIPALEEIKRLKKEIKKDMSPTFKFGDRDILAAMYKWGKEDVHYDHHSHVHKFIIGKEYPDYFRVHPGKNMYGAHIVAIPDDDGDSGRLSTLGYLKKYFPEIRWEAKDHESEYFTPIYKEHHEYDLIAHDLLKSLYKDVPPRHKDGMHIDVRAKASDKNGTTLYSHILRIKAE